VSLRLAMHIYGRYPDIKYGGPIVDQVLDSEFCLVMGGGCCLGA
jgi:hypothetical protein